MVRVRMAINVTTEKLISLAQAARRLPAGRLDRPVSPETLTRWIIKGVPLPDGRVDKLDGVRLGSRWITSEEAVARFVAAQTPDVDRAMDPPKPVRPNDRAAARAGERLKVIGI